MAKAIDHSHDLKISEFDIAAKREAVKERVFDYLPSVQFRSYAEYYKDLTDGTSTSTSVGEEYFTDGSRWQNTYSLSAQLTLFDFGVRDKRMEIAELDVRSSESLGRNALLDLKFAVLEEYSGALIADTEVRLRREMLPLLEKIGEIRHRTHAAGLSDQLAVVEADAQVDQARSAIIQQELELETRLANLTFYTGEEYVADGLIVGDLPDPGKFSWEYDVKSHPEVQRYDQEILKKQAELSAVRAAMLPSIAAYSKYSFYGTDNNSFNRAMDDVSERGYTVGLVVTLPVSEDFRSMHTIRRNELEMAGLKAERANKITELENTNRGLELRYKYLVRDVAIQRGLLSKIEDELKMCSRLVTEKYLDREAYVYRYSSLSMEVLAQNRVVIERGAVVLKLCAVMSMVNNDD